MKGREGEEEEFAGPMSNCLLRAWSGQVTDLNNLFGQIIEVGNLSVEDLSQSIGLLIYSGGGGPWGPIYKISYDLS